MIARSTRVPSIKLLPERVQLLVRSGEPIDRLEAIIDLERIRSSPDKRTAQAATAAIETLTADDSRRVAQRAVQALGHEPAASAATAPAPAEVASPAPVHEEPSRVGVQPVVDPPRHAAVPGRAGPSAFALDMVRAAARGLLGSLIGVELAIVIAPKIIDAPDPGAGPVNNALLWVAGTALVVASLIELLRLRLPARSIPVWTALASNRWAEAATVGVAVGIVFMVLGPGQKNLQLSLVSILLTVLVGLPVGFVVAEAIVGKARPHAAPGSAAR